MLCIYFEELIIYEGYIKNSLYLIVIHNTVVQVFISLKQTKQNNET